MKRHAPSSISPLGKNLNVRIRIIANVDKTQGDGTVKLVSVGGPILFLLKEDENEFGDGGCDRDELVIGLSPR